MYANSVYIKPYCRIAPYLVGMALGYVFFFDNKHTFIRKLKPVRPNLEKLRIYTAVFILLLLLLHLLLLLSIIIIFFKFIVSICKMFEV
jgi:hypothetical protein